MLLLPQHSSVWWYKLNVLEWSTKYYARKFFSQSKSLTDNLSFLQFLTFHFSNTDNLTLTFPINTQVSWNMTFFDGSSQFLAHFRKMYNKVSCWETHPSSWDHLQKKKKEKEEKGRQKERKQIFSQHLLDNKVSANFLILILRRLSWCLKTRLSQWHLPLHYPNNISQPR